MDSNERNKEEDGGGGGEEEVPPPRTRRTGHGNAGDLSSPLLPPPPLPADSPDSRITWARASRGKWKNRLLSRGGKKISRRFSFMTGRINNWVIRATVVRKSVILNESKFHSRKQVIEWENEVERKYSLHGYLWNKGVNVSYASNHLSWQIN